MKAVFFDSIDNTQDYALENFEQEPLLVVSYFQEKGRGTDNRAVSYTHLRAHET